MRVMIYDQESGKGRREVECEIIDGGVMQGNTWRKGVSIKEDTHAAECVAYAINEGRKLCDTWMVAIPLNSRGDDPSYIVYDTPDETYEVSMEFVVSHATSKELEELDLINSDAPTEAIVTLSNGTQYTVDRRHNLADEQGKVAAFNLSQLAHDFTLTCAFGSEPFLGEK